MKFTAIKILYITLAFLFLGLGLLGIAIPILPTTPFLLLASFFFAKGSEGFHKWFTSTKIYKKYLEEFISNRAMPLKKKLCILLPVSAMLVTTFILIDSIYARIAIVLVIIFKYYYFFNHIETTVDYDSKVNKEKKVVKLMIMIYCKGHKHHVHSDKVCQSCNDLIEYVDKRIELCPFMEAKSYCNNCRVHCYKANMRAQIKEVMRYSGSRMIFYHPIIAIDHACKDIIHRFKNKSIKNKKEGIIHDK